MSGIDPQVLERLSSIAKGTPKKDNLVIFIGRVGGALIDNSKYAFLDCVRHFPQLSCYFLTHDKTQRELLARHKLPCLLFPEPEAIQICARAGVVVSDDFWWRSHSPVHALLQGARIFQLWHGIPLKKIGFPEIESSVNMDPAKAAYLRSNYSGYDAVLSTSPWATEQTFAKSFDAKDFPELGYPRNDAMLRAPDKYDMLNVDAQLYGELRQKRKQGWKVVFYMPTFRDTGGDPFSDGALTGDKLLPFLERERIMLVCKFHPYVSLNMKSNSPNLRFCQSGHDAYPLLRLADALLTDYSSIYFDYLLLDRPMLFFLYDHEDYISRSRELNFPVEQYTPGPKSSTQEELFEHLAAVVRGEDTHAVERAAMLDKCFSHHDDQSGVRVNQYIRSQFVDARRKAAKQEVTYGRACA